MSTTRDQKLRYPAGSASVAVSQDLENLAKDVEHGLVRYYLNAEDRTSRLAGVTVRPGSVCYLVTPGVYERVSNAGTWQPFTDTMHDEWVGAIPSIPDRTVTGIGGSTSADTARRIGLSTTTGRISQSAADTLRLINPSPLPETWLVQFLVIFVNDLTDRSLIQIEAVGPPDEMIARSFLDTAERITVTVGSVFLAANSSRTLRFTVYQQSAAPLNGCNFRIKLTRQ